ncbi:MAG TPA: hypothetical protein VHT91_20560 [Kofleriaceae bacterium]|jgi:hypothetical protein|nr:hypothetical protein [Kofleriaceae bacterium]
MEPTVGGMRTTPGSDRLNLHPLNFHHRRHHPRATALAGALAAGAILTPARDAAAFAEDVCYAPGSGPLASCGPLPEVCRPAGTDTAACKAALIAVVARQRNASDGGRSSVHTDVTFLLAQAVGFSATDAYWIAAYDESADLGGFEIRDNDSRPVGGGALATADVSGLVRTDAMSGGVLLHVIAPYNHGRATPPPGIDGLHPDPTDAATEVTLANFRAWALAASSAAKPACTAGLTVQSAAGDYATGAACFASGTPIQAAIRLFGPLDLPFSTQAGPQLVQDSAAPVRAPDFDALVATDGAHDASAGHAADARLGVYLHMLADRISHHVCADRSVISGPSAAGFSVDLTNPECAQGIHLLRHAWETGVDYARLLPQDRTTLAMLQSVYQELVAFARARGVLRPGADFPATQAAYTAELARALQTFQVADRIAALDAVGCAHNLAPLPGQPACPSR